MKLNLHPTDSPSRSSERGMAVVTVLILTAILLIFVAGNIRTLGHLQKELRLIERKQLQDPHTTTGPKTNAAPARNSAGK